MRLSSITEETLRKQNPKLQGLSIAIVFAISVGVCAAMKLGARPGKPTPAMRFITSKADSMMKVLGQCCIGESYAAVAKRFQGASKVEFFHGGPRRLTVRVMWPKSERQFNGSFVNGSLVWGSEKFACKAQQGRILTTGIINRSCPVEPAVLATIVGARGAVVSKDFHDNGFE